MRITRLKLSGFKSFVEPADLVIAPGLTGVVGPNGCGKSNLLEAIRWVMGEGSARTLRGGAMEDVIFAGTTSRPRREFAEVTLHAEAVTGPIPGLVEEEGHDGEVEVIRRIERGAGSAYRINGRDVRAKDVGLLFADAATGAHSPALVSQGRIAAVIAARPQERRQMLEEAAGIAGLHVRRRDAEQKLRATEANLERLGELMADMDNRAQTLRRQARAAERYSALSERISVAEARALFARYRVAVREEEAAQGEAARTEQAVATERDAHAAAAAAANAAREAQASAQAEAQRRRDAASEAGHALDRLRGERRSLERRIEDLQAQLSRLAEDEGREKALDRDAAEAGVRLSVQATDLAAALAAEDARVPELQERIATGEASAHEAELALARAMTRQAEEQAERRVAEAALMGARQRLERAAAESQKIDAARAALPDRAPIAAKRAEAETARAAAEAAATEADAATAAAETARAAAATARDEAERTLAAARATLAALNAEEAALRKATRAPDGSTRAIDRVRAAPGYERALAAALGDDLAAPIAPVGNIRWAGATPLALDPPCPEDCASLADHVSAPPELLRALSLVIVADSDDGRNLLAGQTLVTREGRTRRWDGYATTGGGAAAAERLTRLNRLDAIAAEKPGLEEAVAGQQGALSAAEEAMRTALAEARAARLAANDAREAIRRAERTIDEQAALDARLNERAADLDRRAADQAGELSAAQGAYELAAAAVADLPPDSGTTEEIIRLNSESAAARRMVQDLRGALSSAQRSSAQIRDRLQAVEAERQSWQARAADAGVRLADMAKRREQLTEQQAVLLARPASLDERIAAADRDRAAAADAARLAGDADRAAAAALSAADAALAQANEALTRAREARATAAARAEHAVQRRQETTAQSGERFQCPPPVLPERFGFDSGDVASAGEEQDALDRMVAERERMGPVNLVAAQELAEIEAEQAKGMAERDELAQAVNQLRGSVGSLNREGRQRLLAAFEAVNGHFQRLFTALFNGGSAHLALVDSDDPLEAGLEIMAQPPGKKLATLTLLSGGEQALTAVALIFGLFLTNPAPICVLDEVDAPLDDANVERFCDLLDRMARDTDTRYLIVTHNAVTMSRMHRLFGVTMVEQGVSRLVSVDLQGAERLLSDEV